MIKNFMAITKVPRFPKLSAKVKAVWTFLSIMLVLGIFYPRNSASKRLNGKWVLLEGLNDKWDVALQEAKLFRSFWRDCSSSDDLMCLKHLVSSAKSRALLQWIVSGRSFMYKMNRRGPRMLPWGTPDITGRRWKWTLLMDTNWNLFVR